MANYRKLISEILHEGARSTKWDVIIPVVASSTSIDEEKMSLLARDVTLPSLGVKTMTKKYKGRDIPLAGQVSVSNDFDISFLVDRDHNIRKYFEEWILKFDSRGYECTMISSKLDEVLKGQFSSDKDLYKDITINQYPFDAVIEPGSTVQPVASYVMYGCFPTSIGSFSYGSDGDNIFELKVSFNCCYYERVYDSVTRGGIVT